MIDPILFTLDLGFAQLTIRWYGIIVVTGVLVAAFYAAWYFRRKGEDPNIIWDVLIWLLISGIIGARLWYVLADIIGGNNRYLEDPSQIVKIWQGGLNILGGVIVGTLVGWYYCKRNRVDFWLMADALGVGYLIGQAVGRLGNFINQELYGPPTTLPWGISIAAEHRIAPWNDLAQFPVETTRFHPTFAYEMIWNLLCAGLLIYLVLKKGDRLRTGVLAGGALIAAGVGRAWLELYFRPDQPPFFGLPVSTSFIISVLFALLGVFIVLVKSDKISVPFMQPGTVEIARRPVRRPPTPRKTRREKLG